MSWGSRVALVALVVLSGCGPLTTTLGPLIPADKAYSMPTASMEPTVLLGDYFLAESFERPSPEIFRGDVIIFRYPLDETETYVKRVVGLPGDRLRIQAKELILNGSRVDEPYAEYRTDYIDSYRDYFPSPPNVPVSEPVVDMLRNYVESEALVVPDGYYFVLGDNRDFSSDSRYFGLVAEDLIIGRPWRIYYSAETDTEGGPATIRWSRIGKAVEGYRLGERK